MDITEEQILDRDAKFSRSDLHIHSVVGSDDVSDNTATRAGQLCAAGSRSIG